jgi:hypothetical protein
MPKFLLVLLSVLITPVIAISGEVVIIGDSLSVGSPWDDDKKSRSGLGRELGKLLEQDGHKVSVVASCGSSPLSYISKYKTFNTPCGYYQKYAGEEKIDRSKSETPKLKDILGGRKSPDLMVIQQGTNLYWAIQNGTPKYVEDKVAELLQEYKASAPRGKCLWIGPPAILKINQRSVTKEQTELMTNSIKAGIVKSGVNCEFIDSRLNTNTTGLSGDGTHYRTGTIDDWINKSFEVTKKLLALESNIDCETHQSSTDHFLNDVSKIKKRIEDK